MSIVIIEGARIAIIASSFVFLFAFIFLLFFTDANYGLIADGFVDSGLIIFAQPFVTFTKDKFTEEIGSIGQESKSSHNEQY